MRKRKLLLIGWDAADWQIIDRLLAEGKMPALASFLRQGVRGNIATLSPTLSPILWTSIATGKRAHDHGICGFVESLPAEDKVIPVRGSSRQSKAVWNILNEAGLKTNLVNWWPSHPAEVVNGVAVSNQYHGAPPAYGEAWPLNDNAIYPPELKSELATLRLHPAELTLAHLRPFIPEAATLDPEKDPVLKGTLKILAHTSSVHNAATWLMEHRDWDFMALYQESLDHFSHLAMRYHPPQLASVNDEEYRLYHDVISAAYRFHDMMLERLLELAGPHCDVILLSDHGYRSGPARIEELPDIPAAPALEHRQYGVFAAAGPSFKTDSRIYGASLLDITPTILHHFALPVGEDMPGSVMVDLYPQAQRISEIPSWEITGNAPRFLEDAQGADAAQIRELQALGYVSLPEDSKSEYVRRELLYNRCLSLLEGQRFKEARSELLPEWQNHHELRFGLLLAEALQSLSLINEWDELITEMTRYYPGNGAVLYNRGMWCLAVGEPEKARKHFRKLEEAGVESTQVFLEIGQTWLVQNKPAEARRYFDLALETEPGNTRALTGKAQVMLDDGHTSEALALLEKSLNLQFYQPRAHYLMAMAALEAGNKETAQQALEVCLQQAPRHQAAARKLRELKGLASEKQVDPVIIVSGWPRSGTSMMMRLLEEAGVEAFTDHVRKPDQNNPEGYYEHEQVLKIGQSNDWISDNRGKAVKVVRPLLRYLPAGESYKIIMMERPLTEVILSQEIMKGGQRDALMKNFPFKRALDMQQEEERLQRWIDRQANMEVLRVSLERCIEDPQSVTEEISRFLNRELNVAKAVGVPSKSRPRNKLGQ